MPSGCPSNAGGGKRSLHEGHLFGELTDLHLPHVKAPKEDLERDYQIEEGLEEVRARATKPGHHWQEVGMRVAALEPFSCGSLLQDSKPGFKIVATRDCHEPTRGPIRGEKGTADKGGEGGPPTIGSGSVALDPPNNSETQDNMPEGDVVSPQVSVGTEETAAPWGGSPGWLGYLLGWRGRGGRARLLQWRCDGALTVQLAQWSPRQFAAGERHGAAGQERVSLG